MREITVYLTEEEHVWVKERGGNNFFRHIVQWMMMLERVSPWAR